MRVVDQAGQADPSGRRRAAFICAVLTVVLCLGGLKLDFAQISSTLPYPRQVDEPTIADAAHHMLTTGSLHPVTFGYPALPKYLAAAGMAFGFLRGSTHFNVTSVDRIGNVGYPYYNWPAPMEGARQAFALTAAAALLITAWCAWLAWGEPLVILLAPALVLVSPLFFYHSWNYLNVDIVDTMFVIATVAAVLDGGRRPSLWRCAILPGALAGLAVASKYTMAIAIVPVLLGVWLYVAHGRRVSAAVLACVSMVAAFLMGAPYSLIDLPHFLNGVAYEGHWYASGQAGYTSPAGWSQLTFHLGHLVSDFGVAGVSLAVLGVAVSARADWRRTAVLLSVPVGLLLLLMPQQTHYTRNVLALHPIVGLFAALGLVAACRWVLRRRAPDVRWRAAAVLAAAVLVALAFPWPHVVDMFRLRTDSRNIATAWLDAEVPNQWTIVVTKQLDFDTRPLEANGHRVMQVDLLGATTEEAVDRLMAPVPMPAVILYPHWGADPHVFGGVHVPMLNALTARWSPIRTFGSEPIIFNHPNHAPTGNPEFSVGPLGVPMAWLQWQKLADRPEVAR